MNLLRHSGQLLLPMNNTTVRVESTSLQGRQRGLTAL